MDLNREMEEMLAENGISPQKTKTMKKNTKKNPKGTVSFAD